MLWILLGRSRIGSTRRIMMDQSIFLEGDAGIPSYLEGWGGLNDRGEHRNEIHHEEIHTEVGYRSAFSGR